MHRQVGSHADGWWARERGRLLHERLGPHVRTARLMLDVGCGRADLARRLGASRSAFTVACDIERGDGWRNHRGNLVFLIADATHLPFRDGAFDLSLALDVVEHFADDHAPLADIARVTRQHGHVALTVPARPELWSEFDRSVGHYRRYRSTDLERACLGAGLRPVDTTYFFSWLVPPAWILRKRNRRDADRIPNGRVGRALDRAVAGVGRVERAWLRGHRLPIGTSLWSLAVVEARP